jgi:hypothetical protein
MAGVWMGDGTLPPPAGVLIDAVAIAKQSIELQPNALM